MKYAKVVATIVAAFLLLAFPFRSKAQSKGLEGAVNSATTVIVGRLDQFIAEPEPMDRMVEEQARSSGILTGNPSAIVMQTINPRGTYAFHVLAALKGMSPQPLVVRLGRVTSERSFSGSGSGIPLKGTYMLILTGSQETGFAATYNAPMRVSDKLTLPKEPVDEKATPGASMAAVVQLLIDSLDDPATRGSAAFQFRDAVNERAAEAMRKFLDDPDDGLRASAIECLATNQDVTVIPRIANWKFSDPNRGGNGLLSSLSKFKTPAAIPYLNQLLLDKTSPFIPLDAAQALRQLPLDKSSTPFWMTALHDTEQQGIAAYGAYSSLHKMYPELGAPGNAAYFRANRVEETRKLDEWWTDEQAGKHKQ